MAVFNGPPCETRNRVDEKTGATAATITLGSLADGAGRISTQINNGEYFPRSGQVSVKLKSGAIAHTDGSLAEVYLVRSDGQSSEIIAGTYGAADAAVAARPTNAELIGSVVFGTATATNFQGVFHVDNLPQKFSILIWNATGQALDTTNGNHAVVFVPEVPAEYQG